MATLPGATCTGQDVVQRLTSDGYVIVSGLMSERDVEAARADLGRVLEATPKGRNHFEGFDTPLARTLGASAGSGCLNRFSALLSGASAGVRLPRGEAGWRSRPDRA